MGIGNNGGRTDETGMALPALAEVELGVGCLEQAATIANTPPARIRARAWIREIYYATFHLARASLLSLGVEPKSPEGVQSMLALHLVRPGLLPKDSSARFNRLMADRHMSDYDGVSIVDEVNVQEAAATAGPLLDALAGWLTQNPVRAIATKPPASVNLPPDLPAFVTSAMERSAFGFSTPPPCPRPPQRR